MRAVGLAAATLVLVLACTAAPASPTAHRVYFVKNGAIEAITDRGAARVGPVTTVVRPVESASLALSVTNQYIFWWQETSTFAKPDLVPRIWRARLDGSDAHPIISTDITPNTAVVGAFIYWIGDHGIGRARLDGTQAAVAFVPLRPERGGGVADGLATDGRYLYFGRCDDGEIGRVDADGSGLRTRFIAIGAKNCTPGIAVGGRFIYWCNGRGPGGRIGRAKLNGTGADSHWLNTRDPMGPVTLAANRDFIYWTHEIDKPSSTVIMDFVGAARTDGTHIRQVIVRTGANPLPLALSP
jgi:hypothetical protein